MALPFFSKVTPATSCDNTITEVCGVEFKESFAYTMATAMYSRVFHEVADRAMLPPDVKKDSYGITIHNSYSPYKKGLVHIVVDAMVNQEQRYYRRSNIDGAFLFEKLNKTDVVKEDGKIDADILELDFRQFDESGVVLLLFQLLQGVMATVSKNVTVSGALLFKIHKLSELVENKPNSEALKKQLAQLNEGLTQGKPGFTDAQSSVEFPMFDSSPAEAAIKFIYSMISSITGLPNSYIMGEVVGGLGDTSGSDDKRLNTTLKKYFHEVWAGVVYAVYDKPFQYKNMIIDIAGTVQLFNFVEYTTLLSEEGKLKFMLNNTPFEEGDFNITTVADPLPTTNT